ncbi:hypothetical protein ACIP4U_35715 [Streptomyces caelestis]|uniref:hypothetical protein n=1 Tax=Streptomyces caelestis TaxID=36816 RepID=UPI0016212873|nr:hypothetical protein [Streptomyces caelestis]GGW49179.1 hypothetical protein GCM10010320_32020 [Streptomyces caelestis]
MAVYARSLRPTRILLPRQPSVDELRGRCRSVRQRVTAPRHAQWAADFQSFLRGKGDATALVDGAWPLRELADA